MPEIAYIALGSNLGDRAEHLSFARRALAELPRTRVLKVSRIEETAPIGPAGQDPYLNQMAAVETALGPRELLARLQAIEAAAGRVRSERWGPRTLDLDIVSFGTEAVHEPGLTIPHPALLHRSFWQRQLQELQVNDA